MTIFLSPAGAPSGFAFICAAAGAAADGADGGGGAACAAAGGCGAEGAGAF